MSTKAYKNETQYRRSTKDAEHPYTMISQNLIRDTNLNLIEVGIMTHLLSHDESYIIHTTYIQKISGIGQDKFYKSIKHLIELGYILKVPYFGGVCWIINEIPLQVFDNGTSSEKTNCLLTIRAKTTCVNTNCLNTNCLFHTLRSINKPITIEELKIEEDKNETNKNESVLCETDLGSVSLQSLASPSVLAPSLHTPNIEVEKVDPAKVVLNDTLPTVEKSELPIEVKTLPIVEKLPLPIVPDVRFSEQLKLYTTSKYFLKDNLSRVLEIYQYYGNKYPKAFMSIETFEEVLVYLIITQLGAIKYVKLNICLKIYRNDIETRLAYVPQLYKEMQDNPTDVQDLLKEYELEINNTNENLHSDKIPTQVLKVDLKPMDDDNCKDITSLTPTERTNANPMTDGQDKTGLEDVPEPEIANEEICDDFPDLPF
jgi:hypothetical protein